MAPENRPLTSIRGFASLWVFTAHVSSVFYTVLPHRLAIALDCGWLGVDIFFVLSGFILATVYEALAPAGWGRFALKRVMRVFPLNTALMAFFVLCALLGISSGAAVDWHYLPWHLLMLQSFVPGHKVGWIFVNWSVGVELLCYLAFPLLVLGLRHLNRAALAVATLAAALLTYRLQLHVLGSFFGGNAVLRCGPEFVLGAAAATLALRVPRLSPRTAGVMEVVAVVALLAGVTGGLSAEWCAAIGSRRMASIPLAAAALIFALASDAGPLARLLRWAPLFWLGQVSFSLYLIHWPLMVRCAPLAWIWSGGPPPVGVVAVWGGLILALGLALSAVMYWFIEVPGRRLAKI